MLINESSQVPWVVAGEVAPNHLRTISMSLAIGVNWLFSFTISKLTPIMLNDITYGTFLIFGFMCLIMSVWAYAFFPETAGYALEDIKYLFEKDVIVRALQDAPGGKIFLGGRQAESVEELRRLDSERAEDGVLDSNSNLEVEDQNQKDFTSHIERI